MSGASSTVPGFDLGLTGQRAVVTGGSGAIGAEICRQPLWLASALERIQQGASRIDYPAAERNPATAHMFIINPLHAHKVDGLFTTHPSTQNRVAKLKAMAAVMHSAPPAETGPLRQSSIPASGRRGPAGPWR